MSDIFNPSFSESKYSDKQAWQNTNALPSNFQIERAETQTDVNATVLNFLVQKFKKEAPLNIIDLPCGQQQFAGYVKQLFPNADVTAVDIIHADAKPGIKFLQMDIGEPFTIPTGEQFDIITSVSGIMMFSNTKLFLQNCISRLKKEGTFVITNDNSATLKDKLTYLFFGSLRMFPPVFLDGEWVTENVPIQELVRLLRTNGMEVKDIVYTSSNSKDYIIWPLAILIYPLQRWYLRKSKNALPEYLIRKMFPFKHLFCRHYIVIAEKTIKV